VTIGNLWINVPVFAIIFGSWIGAGYFAFAIMPTSRVLLNQVQWTLAVVTCFLAPVAVAWLWWSIMVPKWRIWALERVDDWPTLESEARRAGLIWNERDPWARNFARTEIWSQKDRERESKLRRERTPSSIGSSEPSFVSVAMPKNVIRFAWLWIAAKLLAIPTPYLLPADPFGVHLQIDRSWMLTSMTISLVVGYAISFSIFWLAVWRQENWARWLLFVWFALSLPGLAFWNMSNFRPDWFPVTALSLSSAFLQAVSFYFAFTGGARDWFRRKAIAGKSGKPT
jgi:hypothetical protein